MSGTVLYEDKGRLSVREADREPKRDGSMSKVLLNGLRHGDFAVLGQFCAKSITNLLALDKHKMLL